MANEFDRPKPPNPKGLFGRLAQSLFPENSVLPKLSAEGWKTVLLRLIDKLPRWGLVFLIWTATVLVGIWLILKELT